MYLPIIFGIPFPAIFSDVAGHKKQSHQHKGQPADSDDK
jgi:hypothetical protein